MKKIIFIFTAFLFFSCLEGFAGDAAKITTLGFSNDGRYFAFMESGIGDGLGAAYARIRFLDTPRNAFAGTAVQKSQTEEEVAANKGSLQTIERDTIALAQPTLTKLGIKSENRGNVLVSRKVTDLEARALRTISFSTTPIIAGLISPKFQLNLSQIKAIPGEKIICMDPDKAKILRLTLVDQQTKKQLLLQADTTLPSSRGCAHAYEIEDVLQFQSNLVVLIRIYTVGFEGEDVRYLAISGPANIP